MNRFPVQEIPALDRRPEPERTRRPGPGRERSGHRRDYDPSREKRDINERKNAAIADVSQYRVVAVSRPRQRAVRR